MSKGQPRNYSESYVPGEIVQSIEKEPLLKTFVPDSFGSPSLHLITGIVAKMLTVIKKDEEEK